MKMAELKKELELVMEKETEYVGLAKEDNPQMRKTGDAAKTRVSLIGDIIKRINGDRLALIHLK